MRESILTRFKSKIKFNLQTDCWEWVAGKGNFGYGSFWMNGKSLSAHRASYELFNEIHPGSAYVLHKCDNPACCNPKHLFLGTQKDNMVDMISKGRKKWLVGKDLPQTKLTEDIVLDIKKKQKSQRKYAAQYGISQSTVGEIQRNMIWKHVKPATPVPEGGPF